MFSLYSVVWLGLGFKLTMGCKKVDLLWACTVHSWYTKYASDSIMIVHLIVRDTNKIVKLH